MAARRSLAMQANHCDMVPPGVDGGCYPKAAAQNDMIVHDYKLANYLPYLVTIILLPTAWNSSHKQCLCSRQEV